eukprot:3547773-Lingulodinium_polyedra.AAC.1
MYRETVAKLIAQRARRDARALGVPLVCLQAVDECNTIDKIATQRLLNVPNLHELATSMDPRGRALPREYARALHDQHE